jgi:hypothetical protein
MLDDSGVPPHDLVLLAHCRRETTLNAVLKTAADEGEGGVDRDLVAEVASVDERFGLTGREAEVSFVAVRGGDDEGERPLRRVVVSRDGEVTLEVAPAEGGEAVLVPVRSEVEAEEEDEFRLFEVEGLGLERRQEVLWERYCQQRKKEKGEESGRETSVR